MCLAVMDMLAGYEWGGHNHHSDSRFAHYDERDDHSSRSEFPKGSLRRIPKKRYRYAILALSI